MEINISFPSNVKFLVKANQDIDLQTPLYEEKQKKTITINLAKKLKIKPEKIFDYLNFFVGDEIKKNDIIASKKDLFQTKTCLSEFNGLIKEINHHTGEIILTSQSDQSMKNKSSFKGKIINIEKNNLIINLPKGHQFQIKKTNFEFFGGKSLYLLEKHLENLTRDQIEQNIMIIEIPTSYLQIKAEALGGKGFITLKSLPETTNAPFALLKKRDDFKKIFTYNHKYCLFIKNKMTVYFYD